MYQAQYIFNNYFDNIENFITLTVIDDCFQFYLRSRFFFFQVGITRATQREEGFKMGAQKFGPRDSHLTFPPLEFSFFVVFGFLRWKL